MPVNIHQIRAANITDAPFIDVPVEKWGEVRIKRLTPDQLATFKGSANDLIVLCALNDGGAPLFVSDEDKAILVSHPEIAAQLGDEALKLNGLSN
jgi:hypothetical protein